MTKPSTSDIGPDIGPRIAPLEVSDDPTELQGLFEAAPLRLIGKRNFFRTLAHHPRLLQGYMGFIGGLRHGILPPRERELTTLRVAAACRCDFVVHQHTSTGLAAGLTADEVALLCGDRPEQGPWNDHDRALLQAIDELVTTHRMSDESWGMLSRDYSDAQMLEFLFFVGRVVMAAGFLNSVQVDFEDEDV